MRFRITPHAGHDAPDDAVEKLLAALEGRRTPGRFYRIGAEIRVNWGLDDGGGWDRSERQELERDEVLEELRAVCRSSPRLSVDWYAVGPLD